MKTEQEILERIAHIKTLKDGYGTNTKRIKELEWVLKPRKETEQVSEEMSDAEQKPETATNLLLDLFAVSGHSEQLVCEHEYQYNVCDWRGVRKCIICGKMEKTN